MTQIQSFMPAVELVLPDEDTPEHYGQIAAQLAASRFTIPQNDVWIAALAIQHGLPLWTMDAHFQNVRGLTLAVP